MKYRVDVKKLSKITWSWLAGLLEGEASFQWCGTPTISVQMTDEDVIAKLAEIWQRKYASYQPPGNRKMTYIVRLHGLDAEHFMEKLRPLMGLRRTKQIDEVLKAASKRLSYKNQRLDDEVVREIRLMAKLATQSDVCKKFGVYRHVVIDILRGRTYKDVI